MATAFILVGAGIETVFVVLFKGKVVRNSILLIRNCNAGVQSEVKGDDEGRLMRVLHHFNIQSLSRNRSFLDWLPVEKSSTVWIQHSPKLANKKASRQVDLHYLNSSSNPFLPIWPAVGIYSPFCSTTKQGTASHHHIYISISLTLFIANAKVIDQPKMAPTTTNSHENGHRKRRLDQQDIRNTISSLTRHLTALGHTRGTAGHGMLPEHDGVRMITLTGSNKGAAMKVNGTAVGQVEETHGMLLGDDKAMMAYTNSNYQAVNNSVLFGGSCKAEDPGVHISFLDFEEEEEEGDKKEDQKGIETIDQSNE